MQRVTLQVNKITKMIITIVTLCDLKYIFFVGKQRFNQYHETKFVFLMKKKRKQQLGNYVFFYN